VLQQLNGGSWQPLAFYSKKLSGAGTRYSTFDRELLAAFSAVRHFRFLLEWRQFRLLTDHMPLVTSLFRTTPPWSARQQRQLSLIAEFTSDIRHTPGQENVVADALSRLRTAAAQQPPSAQPTSPALTAEDWPEEGLVAPERPILAAIADAQPVDFSAMAAAQRSCPEVAEMLNSTTLQITTQAIGNDTLLGDVSTGVIRPLVNIQHRGGGFPVATLHTPPRSAGNPPPHRRSVLLATDGQGHNSNGQELLVLPAGQGSQTRPSTTSRDTNTSPPFCPHPRRPGRPAAALTRPHLSFHNHRPDLEVA
jgi:hypothetical protein